MEESSKATEYSRGMLGEISQILEAHVFFHGFQHCGLPKQALNSEMFIFFYSYILIRKYEN